MHHLRFRWGSLRLASKLDGLVKARHVSLDWADVAAEVLSLFKCVPGADLRDYISRLCNDLRALNRTFLNQMLSVCAY